MFADDIIWSIDLEPGETYEEIRAELELPKCVELPKWLQIDDFDLTEGYAPDWIEDISTWLSNEYGYCVEGFVVR